jgi:beta-glucosidase
LLINAVSKVSSNVIVVLNNGSPVEMPWIDDVSAVIEAYLPGETGGSAIWDILLGKVNPSGRLAESFPLHLEDNISSLYFPMGPVNVEYRESIYVGYRYYDKAGKPLLFPFGYGLSYTEFSYSDLKLNKTQLNDDETLTATLKVKNTGHRAGMEVVQLYVKDMESTIFKAEKELKSFSKISLEPGEEKTVSFILDKRSFACYNEKIMDWHVESGEFSIMAGSSSRDIKCEKKVYVKSNIDYKDPDNSLKDQLSCYYNIDKVSEIDRNEFMRLLNKNIYEAHYSKKPYHRNSTVDDIKNNFIGRILYMIVMKQIKGMSLENEHRLR